jgi:hypothetical protein
MIALGMILTALSMDLFRIAGSRDAGRPVVELEMGRSSRQEAFQIVF